MDWRKDGCRSRSKAPGPNGVGWIDGRIDAPTRALGKYAESLTNTWLKIKIGAIKRCSGARPDSYLSKFPRLGFFLRDLARFVRQESSTAELQIQVCIDVLYSTDTESPSISLFGHIRARTSKSVGKPLLLEKLIFL
jgi:hypothetical protein